MEEAKPRMDRNKNKIKSQLGYNKAKTAHVCKLTTFLFKDVQAVEKLTIYKKTLSSQYAG